MTRSAQTAPNREPPDKSPNGRRSRAVFRVSDDPAAREAHGPPFNYAQISTVMEYVLVAQDTREVTLHRREEHWRRVLLTAHDAPVEFRAIALTLPLSQIYEGVP